MALTRILTVPAAAMLAVSMCQTASAAILVESTAYTENFDSMGANGLTTPTDWYVAAVGALSKPDPGPLNTLISAFPGTPSPNVVTAVDDGSGLNGANGRGGIYNYGAAGDADRALGLLASGSVPVTTLQPGMAASAVVIEASFIANAGFDIENLEMLFDEEQWHSAQALNSAGERSNPLVAYFSTDPINLGWAPMGADFDLIEIDSTYTNGALNGNDPANRMARGGIFTPSTPIQDGSEFYIRWIDHNDAGMTDAGMAIDNFSIRAIPVPEPTSLAALGLASGLLFRRRRQG